MRNSPSGAARPGFASLVILVLALGIGANCALFTVVNSLMLRALPYQRPAELVELQLPSRALVEPLRGWPSSACSWVSPGASAATSPGHAVIRSEPDGYAELLGVTVLMRVIAIGAPLLPARWAAGVDPVDALRHD